MRIYKNGESGDCPWGYKNWLLQPIYERIKVNIIGAEDTLGQSRTPRLRKTKKNPSVTAVENRGSLQ
jgi:hypothetical protein